MVLGDFSCRILLPVCGYAWPAYNCFKAIEQKDEESVREWCIYWFVLALFTMAEPLVDAFAWWLPIYYSAKVAFVVYLWHPKFKGALSLYNSTVQPLLRKHEATIDLKVEEARAWLGDVFSANLKWFISFMQSKAGSAVAQLQSMQGRSLGSSLADGSLNMNWPSAAHAAENMAAKVVAAANVRKDSPPRTPVSRTAAAADASKDSRPGSPASKKAS